MEALVATAIGILVACGVYLALRPDTFAFLLGLVLASHGTNLLLFATGRLTVDRPPLISGEESVLADPLPQALTLTAIVISFALTALVSVLALSARLELGSDRVDAEPDAKGDASS